MEKSQLIEEVIRRYSKDIKVIANKYYIVGGSTDDLFQEGMIGLVQAVHNYDIKHGAVFSESFKKFVLMCAKRQIIDAIKYANRKKNLPLNNYVSFDNNIDNKSEIIELSNKKIQNPETILIEKEDIEEKNKTIKIALSDFEKQTLNLYLEGKKQSEIAKSLNKTTKSIDNTLQRVKNKLKGK